MKRRATMDGRLLLGLILVFLGGLFFSRNFLGLTIPIGEIFWPSILIIIGLVAVFRPKRLYTRDNISGKAVFDNQRIEATSEEREYSAIFGRLDVDLTKIQVQEKTINIEVEAVFGGGSILIDEKIPMRIDGSAAFGGVTFPDGTTAAFGDRVYTTSNYQEAKPHLHLKANAVFGGLKISQKG